MSCRRLWHAKRPNAWLSYWQNKKWQSRFGRNRHLDCGQETYALMCRSSIRTHPTIFRVP